MKTVKTLLNTDKDMTMGNHYIVHKKNNSGHSLRVFFYYDTPICTVNDTKKTFFIDDSYGTVSTTRTCNAYRNELQATHKEIEL